MAIIPKADKPNESGALIGYNSLLVSTEGAAVKALTKNTYERWYWEGVSGMVGAFTAGVQNPVGGYAYFAIGAHNLFSAGVASVSVEYRNQSSSLLYSFSIIPTDNNAIMVIFDKPITGVSSVTVQVFGGTNKEIGLIYTGPLLRMQQPIYGGMSPIDLSAKTEYQSVMSDTGQFLGRTITQQGTRAAFSWRHLSPDWYREYFQPFVNAAKTGPFFIKWRPDLYPDSVVLGHVAEDIKPVNMGGGNQLMSVGFTIMGHSDA